MYFSFIDIFSHYYALGP